jgi:hypothetical protein
MRSLGSTAIVFVLVVTALSGCFRPTSPGSSGDDFLSRAMPKMIVEIDYQSGKQLASASVDLLRTRIGERLDKPGGVTYEQTAIQASRSVWTVDALRQLEEANRNHYRKVDTVVLYVLVLGGGYEADSGGGRVLGVAYGSSSVAIFKDNIEASATLGGIPLFSSVDVEKAVLIHEFGHILGLVNIGLKMQRPHEMTQDPDTSTSRNEGRGHSNNKDSVMFWAVESDAVARVFNGPPPTQFDADDIADMRAAGGK